jgi:hypothetical protein
MLEVSPLALAGGIIREMTNQRSVYADQYGIVTPFFQAIKEFSTSTQLNVFSYEPGIAPVTHQTIADYYWATGSLPPATLMNPDGFDKLGNFTLFDVGVGRIQIRTAISALLDYNERFQDSDPFGLKQYNQAYDLSVNDLKDPNSQTTIKIAGMIALEGKEFYSSVMSNWNALDATTQAALITKYYTLGREKLWDDFLTHGGNPDTYVPDINGDGSDTFLFQSNPETLQSALQIHASLPNYSFSQDVVAISLDSEGGVFVTKYDIDSTQPWSEHIEQWDQFNRLMDEVFLADNGKQIIVDYDVDDVEAWSKQTIAKDANGIAESVVEVNDAGQISAVKKGRQRCQPDRHLWHSRLAARQHPGQRGRRRPVRACGDRHACRGCWRTPRQPAQNSGHAWGCDTTQSSSIGRGCS